MAQTSTGITACNASLWLDNASGTLTDISGSTNKVSVDFSLETGKKYTLGSSWPKRFQCGKDATIAVDVIYTTAASEAWSILKAWYFAATPGARSFKLYLPNKNVGSDVFSGEVVMEDPPNFDAEAGSGDPIMISFVLAPDGEITHSTAAT